MKSKPKLDDFLNAGAAAAAESDRSKNDIPAPVASRITKSIRILPMVHLAVKDRAHQLTMAGTPTSESDIYEEAVRRLLNI